MAWNPSPKVAAVRDAAAKIEIADRCRVPIAIIIYTTDRGELGYASYGMTKTLCADAGKLAEHLYAEAMEYFSE